MLYRLKQEPFFNDYIIRDDCLIREDKEGLSLLSIDKSFLTTQGNTFYLSINPWFGRRFNVLEEWFEENFSLSKTRLLSEKWFIDLNYTPKHHGLWYDANFSLCENTFDNDYLHLHEIIGEIGIPFLKKYDTLESYFQYIIRPLLEGIDTLPFVGFKWAPRYLVLTKITHPEYYNTVKDIICSALNKLSIRHDIEYLKYKTLIPSILSYIESHSFA